MANTSSVRLQWTPEVGQWFEGKLDEELPPTPEEVQALKDYLIENTSQHNVSAAEAARRLMTVPHGQEAMSDVDAKSLRISDLIMDAQIEFEAQQPLMLDLIHNIEGFRESGDLVDARGREIRHHPPSLACCRQTYQTWDVDATSHWRSARAWRFTPIEDETEEDVARKWTSMNALFANRCRRAFSLQKTAEQKAIGLGDAETIGIGCMTAALEQEPWRTRPENIPTDEKDKPSIMRKYKMAMLNVSQRWTVPQRLLKVH